tara:strand:+ start:392 stop:1024 length:633 start_codon:yes stop_codon:yes gene_type:complete
MKHDLTREAQIHEVFPKVVCRHDNIGLDLIPGMLEMMEDIRDQTAGNSALNVNSSHTTIETLHRLPIFKDLSKEIIRVSRGFMVEYGYDPKRIEDLFMAGMWFNHSNKGNFIFPHIHHGGFLSCAFYLKADPEKHNIVFYDFSKNIIEDPYSYNDLSSEVFSLPCKPGRLLIFHSDFPHGVPLQEHDEEKVVVSCNMLLRNVPSWEGRAA